MSISNLLLAAFLVAFALFAFGWVPVALWVLGLLALSTAIALLIEGLVGSYHIRRG